ncbi:MAG: LptF/LptG family permease, partial [Cocleimonas sp.]|nr:LptF/LptG family permease [Cocleimonas sp.]
SVSELIEKNSIDSIAELHWRLAVILSAPIVALLAFPLSYTTPRQGRFGKLTLGILLYALYANLLMTGRSMLEDGKIPIGVGLWWVHLIFIAFALWLVRKQYGKTG